VIFKETLGVALMMDSDRIRIRMSLFTTFYFEFGHEYEYYRIRIQNGYFEFGFTFEYLLDLQHRVIMTINFICPWFYN
jgi:hypothetical protein